MLSGLTSLSIAQREPLVPSVSRGYLVVLVLLSQTRGPLDFHRARIVFRSPLDAGTFFCVEPFRRTRHPDGAAATATLDVPAWRSRLLGTDAS